MKRAITLLFACLASAVILCAQNRVSLEDSVIVGGISRHAVDLVLGNSKMTSDERLIMHWTYAEIMKDRTREHLSDLTDRELQAILDLYCTEAYGFMMSEAFVSTYVENVRKAFQYEHGEGARFSYAVREKGYGDGLDVIFRKINHELGPVLDDILGEDRIMQKRKYGVPESQVELMLVSARKVKSNLFSIFKASLVDYMSNDMLQNVVRFLKSPEGQKYAAYCQKAHASVDLSSDEFVSSFKEVLETRKPNNTKAKTSLADYVAISRAFPESFPELLRPYAEMNLGENRYQGQTRDNRPYGKGKLTDKKGVVYEGDFKDGKRHGVINVTKSGKKTVTQFWISDKYVKDVPVGKDEAGKVPAAYVADGQNWGYGTSYDQNLKTRRQGVFIDGQLQGTGRVTEPGRTLSGDFFNGQMVNGTVTWKNSSSDLIEFKGKLAGNRGEGVREISAADGSGKEKHTGIFQGGLLDGKGHKNIVKAKTESDYMGSFAYGKLYGQGVLRQSVSDVLNCGIFEESVYEGCFFADKFHGEGRLKISMTDIPAGPWTFNRCNVLLPSFEGQSVEIVMEGLFDDGTFKEGRISYSNGSWYEGVFDDSGLAEGNMFCRYADGSYYQGGCLDGKYHGYGLMHKADGTEYSGRYEYGEPMDRKPAANPVKKNNLIRNDKLVYEFNDLESGYGRAVLIKPAGVKVMIRSGVTSLKATCTGRFRGDVLIEGKVVMTDGTWLEGVYEDGVLIKGKGKTIDKYRTVYEGEIKNGFPHGEGKCTYADGTWFTGKFAYGNRMGGTHYAADGKVIKVYE